MTYQQEIEASESILEFLQEQTEWVSYPGDAQQKMERLLSSLNFPRTGPLDMLSFTEYLNDKYEILPAPLWKYTAKEFYGTEKAIKFFNLFLRDSKLSILIS